MDDVQQSYSTKHTSIHFEKTSSSLSFQGKSNCKDPEKVQVRD